MRWSTRHCECGCWNKSEILLDVIVCLPRYLAILPPTRTHKISVDTSLRYTSSGGVQTQLAAGYFQAKSDYLDRFSRYS